MEHYKYSSIGQYRNLVSAFKRQGIQSGKFEFTGTVKVHGTNASVVVLPDDEQYAQSKARVLSIESDNFGFAMWHHSNKEFFASYAANVRKSEDLGVGDTIVIYGEWAGQGIQNAVAVAEVPHKFFYMFGVKVIDGNGFARWIKRPPYINLSLEVRNDIVDSRLVWEHTTEIDVGCLEQTQNALVELTEAVENRCPVGVYYGIDGIGEGVVWSSYDPSTHKKFIFKVKGEKHSISKVKNLAMVDPVKVASIEEFVDYAVTVNRLEQGLVEIFGENDICRKKMGKFIQWVSRDIVKEELDVLAEAGLTMKDVGKRLSIKSREWFFEKEILMGVVTYSYLC